MAKFRYIPSAFETAGAFLRIYEYYPEMSIDILESLKNQEPDIDVGVLSNAFSEKRDLKKFWEILEPRGIELYSDSGGLQVISIGKEITPEIKKDIYARQFKYSHQAMSFDEIPMKVLSRSGGGSFGNVSVYVDEYFKTKAIESGKNIAEQIQIFQKLEKAQKDQETKHSKHSKHAKILFIIQGKNFETQREWAWFMFQEIKKVEGYRDYICGLALGQTGKAGNRNAADFILRYQHELEFLPEEWLLNLHILGAGSVSKIIPYLVVSDDYFKKDTIISADSTTQTRAQVFGNYISYNPKLMKLEQTSAGREVTQESDFVTEDIYKFVEPFIDKYRDKYNLVPENVDDFREHYTEYNQNLFRKKSDFDCHYQYTKRVRIGRFFWATSMLSGYLKFLESIKKRSRYYRRGTQEQKQKVLKSFKKSLPSNLYKPLKLIMDLKDHNEYMQDSKILKGHPYPKLDISIEEATNNIVKIGSRYYITDIYEGEVRGRVLQNEKSNQSVSPDTKRGMFLNQLQGNLIDTQMLDNQQVDDLDAW